MNLKLATEIGKCLSNQTRVQIMEWLKAPNKNFPPHDSLRNFDDGVCVTSIKNKSGLSQSTISNYLTNGKVRTTYYEKTRKIFILKKK